MLADTEHEVPLLLAVQAGAPNYVRLLLQYRANPAGAEDLNGSIVSVQEGDGDLPRVMQSLYLPPENVALKDGPPEQPTSAG